MTRSLAILVVSIVGICACGLPTVGPVGPTFGRGWRQLTLRVENDLLTPATLVVAGDEEPRGDVVGTAVPSTIPPDTALDVTLSIPPGRSWAIFVDWDLRNQSGPLITAQDVPPNAAGRVPLTIVITRRGPGVSMPGALPGWFGN